MYPILFFWATLALGYGSWALVLAYRSWTQGRWFPALISTLWGMVGFGASGSLYAIALGA